MQEHKGSLYGLAVSSSFGKVVTAGDTCIKVRELNQLTDIYAIIDIEGSEKGLGDVEVTSDGQLLAVSTQLGSLWVFLTHLPTLGAAYRTKVAILSSLTEITVINEVEQEKPVTFPVDVEPSFIGVGPFHVAMGMNNRAWFYRIGFDSVEVVRDKEYLGSVQAICINTDYACALVDGKVQLHSIEGTSNDDMEDRLFPEPDKSNVRVTTMALTPDFLILGAQSGHLQYYYLEDGKVVNEYKHTCGIRLVAPEHAGTRLIILDEKQDGYVYNPVNDSLIAIPECHGGIKQVLWQNFPLDKDTFLTYDGSIVHTYVYYRETIEGSKVKLVTTTKIPHGHIPLMLYDSTLTCQASSGKTVNMNLDDPVVAAGEPRGDRRSSENLERNLAKCIALKKWANAWNICDQLNSEQHWKSLGSVALYHLEIDFAMRVFRQCGDIGMVWSLDSLLGTEDRKLLGGDVAMFLGEFDLAEKLYLDSTRPVSALEMRRDLLHWDKALQLAGHFAPEEIPAISKEYAQQLEFMGNYTEALQHYEKGLEDEGSSVAQKQACTGGIARMAIRLGQIRKGMEMAENSQNRSLLKECAQILEQLKQFSESGQLYEKADLFDRAAGVYARSKNWLKVGELLPKVHSPKVHSQFAKAMEAERKYKLAAEAYKTAKDYDNVVRILLTHLNSPDEAVKVVRESKSADAAKLVANHFLKTNNYESAIQFLVLSRCGEDAYKLAERHDKMEIFAEVLGEEGSQGDYLRMAQYFDSKRNNKLAGKFYYFSGQYAKALDHLIAGGEDHDSLKLAIECVGAARDSELTRKFVDYLMGEIDGIPKDAKYLFRLYMALTMYQEASKVAIIIAREEQNTGQYRTARDVLYSMYQELKKNNIPVPAEMANNLMLIHSYLLAKVHIKMTNHLTAARLLTRVADSISKFPSHMVPILTSTVIECHRSGLRQSAFKFAAQLMRPEHRSKIDAKYKKKIEGIVRKPDKSEVEAQVSECPFCGQKVPDFQLTCASCQNTIPYCLATGKHIVKNDLAMCPNCKFPAIETELKSLLEKESSCPLCGYKLTASDIVPVEDVSSILQQESSAPPDSASSS